MIDIEKLHHLISIKDAEGVAALIKNSSTTVDGNELVLANTDIDDYYEYWDKRQLVKKINLNSLTV